MVRYLLLDTRLPDKLGEATQLLICKTVYKQKGIDKAPSKLWNGRKSKSYLDAKLMCIYIFLKKKK